MNLEKIHEVYTFDNSSEVIEARKRWVRLLRSGKYQQAQGKLQNVSGSQRCCLGVACDLVVTGVSLPTLENLEDDVVEYIDHNSSYTGVLPRSIAEKLGFASEHPPVVLPEDDPSTDQLAWLAVLNDDGSSFEEIADLIEATYITPFED